jgi:1,4-alpha-glucan branching enzyme
LAKAVSEGRRNEFSHFPLFKDPMQRERIPDPNAIQTFEASRLNWNSMSLPTHVAWKELYQTLLTLRKDHILPLISGCAIPETGYELVDASGLSAHWQFPDQSRLTLLANLGEKSVSGFAPPVSKPIYASDGVTADSLRDGVLPAWSVAWVVEP